MTSQSVTLSFATAQVHNLNRRYHWRTEAALVKAIRHTAAHAALEFLTPMPAAWLAVDIGYPDKRRRDRVNYSKHIKSCVDGFVTDAAVLPDDDDKHLKDGGTRSHVHGQTGVFEFTFTFTPIEGDL